MSTMLGKTRLCLHYVKWYLWGVCFVFLVAGVSWGINQLFGRNIPPLYIHPKQGVNSKHPNNVNKFIQHLDTTTLNQIHTTLTQFNTLHDLTTQQHEQLEQCNTSFTTLLLQADKNVSPLIRNHGATKPTPPTSYGDIGKMNKSLEKYVTTHMTKHPNKNT